MLEDKIVPCPNCGNDLEVKVVRSGKMDTYLVIEDCPNCKTKSGKLERLLNPGKSTRRYEKSYIKTDPRG